MTNTATSSAHSHRALCGTILVVLVIYATAAVSGWAQAEGMHAANEQSTAAEQATADSVSATTPPALYAVLPFVAILGAIAVLPLTPGLAHWWESNLHRFYVAAVLAGLTLLYYLLIHAHPIAQHFQKHGSVAPAEAGPSLALMWTVVENAILNEYVPFIVVLFALFTITGGIRITGDLAAHPATNTAFLAAGGILASLIGTTGAGMLLIRPLLATNAERKHVVHTVIFFIFIACNCGGCLLPIGDPPLFLGYLHGVDFWWTLRNLWPQWLLAVGLLLGIYYVWDRFFAYPHETGSDIALDERRIAALRFSGLGVNVPLLLGVVLAVAMLDPSQPVPGTNWHPTLYMREAVLLGLIVVSLRFGSRQARADNGFSFAPIIEVAVLFLGIFICMQPALQILDTRGAELGLTTPMQFYWATGSLSSVLDNAPTYLVFFEIARTLPATGPTEAGVAVELLSAISLGSVFLGAMTYIGNGPNFMVKSVAEGSGVRMPSFFGYVGYSVAFLLPVLVIVSYFSELWLW